MDEVLKIFTFHLSFTLISTAQIAWQHVEPDLPSPTFLWYPLQGVDSLTTTYRVPGLDVLSHTYGVWIRPPCVVIYFALIWSTN